MEIHALGKKLFTNELDMSLPLQAWVEKAIHEIETHWLSS